MSLVSRITNRVLSVLAAGAALLLPGIATAAIVVASSGPSAKQYPAGSKLDPDARITLQANDSVTILDQRGTKVLRGPGRFSASTPGRPLANPAFAILTRQRTSERVRTGAVRTGEGGGEIMSPNLWFVDIAAPGTKCVADPATIKLWRKASAGPARYVVTGPDGASGAVSFDKGAMIAAWEPSGIAIADASTVSVSGPGGVAIGDFTFRILADPPAQPEDLALALIEKGCTAQLDLLSATLAMARR